MTRVIEAIRQVIRGWIRLIAHGLNKLSRGKLHPDTVTFVGFLMHIPIAVLIATGHWVAAALMLVVFGLFDALDGELARVQHRATNNGGFLDATTDRMKEVLLYSGVAYWFALTTRPSDAAWAVAACGASLCVSYVKAKGEAVVATFDKKLPYAVLNRLFADGLLPFEVRMTLLALGLLTGYLFWAVAAIAVLSAFTALGRMIRISRAIQS